MKHLFINDRSVAGDRFVFDSALRTRRNGLILYASALCVEGEMCYAINFDCWPLLDGRLAPWVAVAAMLSGEPLPPLSSLVTCSATTAAVFNPNNENTLKETGNSCDVMRPNLEGIPDYVSMHTRGEITHQV